MLFDGMYDNYNSVNTGKTVLATTCEVKHMFSNKSVTLPQCLPKNIL